MSVISICNEALAKNHVTDKIPDDADLENPQGKIQEMAALLYPGARRAALRLTVWSCILTRKALSRGTWEAAAEHEVGDTIVAARAVYLCTVAGTSGDTAPGWTSPGDVVDGSVTWTYQYEVKANLPDENYTGLLYTYAVPVDFLLKDEVFDTNGTKVHALIERGILYADSPDAVLSYNPDELDDEQYDALLYQVVVAQVASAFAFPLTGSHENEVAFAQAAMSIATAAAVLTKKDRRTGPPVPEPWKDGLFEPRRQP